jgi:hypothetical protein
MIALQGLALLLLLQTAGELIVRALGIGLPGPVLGLAMLLPALAWAPVARRVRVVRALTRQAPVRARLREWARVVHPMPVPHWLVRWLLHAVHAGKTSSLSWGQWVKPNSSWESPIQPDWC